MVCGEPCLKGTRARYHKLNGMNAFFGGENFHDDNLYQTRETHEKRRETILCLFNLTATCHTYLSNKSRFVFVPSYT